MRYILVAAALLLASNAAARAQNPDKQSFEVIEHGRYVATAADCTACHTATGGQPFAGGGALETPFGILLAPNITPDAATGIGGWTDDEFVNAVQNGIGHGGIHLYPAMPYPYYTKMTREDVIAIRAYLDTVQPIRNLVQANQLPFPFNQRETMIGWNELYFTPGGFKPDPGKSDGMEPRRLPGRGCRTLRAVSYTEERDGRRREQPGDAGFRAAELVRAEHDGQPPDRHRRLDGRRHCALPQNRAQPL